MKRYLLIFIIWGLGAVGLVIWKGWEQLAALATWFLVLGIVFAILQVRQARKSTNAQLAVELFKELRSDRALEVLRFIYSLKPDGLHALSSTDLHSIDYVKDRLDLLGALVDEGIIDTRLAIDAYAGVTALRCWYQLHEWVKEVRDERGYFGDNFEGFARLSLEHFKETHIKVKFYKKYEEDKGIDLVAKLQEKELQPRCFEKIKKDRETDKQG